MKDKENTLPTVVLRLTRSLLHESVATLCHASGGVYTIRGSVLGTVVSDVPGGAAGSPGVGVNVGSGAEGVGGPADPEPSRDCVEEEAEDCANEVEVVLAIMEPTIERETGLRPSRSGAGNGACYERIACAHAVMRGAR